MANEKCGVCNTAIFAAEKPTRVPGNQFHGRCFKCMYITVRVLDYIFVVMKNSM